MKSCVVTLFVSFALSMQISVLLAQSAIHADTIKVISTLHQPIDIPQLSISSLPKSNVTSLKSRLNNIDTSSKDHLKDIVKKRIGQNDEFETKLRSLKPPNIRYTLTLENATRYHPAQPLSVGYTPSQKFVNISSIRGSVEVFGVPLNIDLTTDRASSNSLSGLDHNLFKFDLDPKQFSNMFRSDLEKYYELKRNALGGLDISGYTQKVLKDQLKEQSTKAAGTNVSANGTLTKYLANSNNVNQLLQLNDQQMKAKLREVVANKVPDGAVKIPDGKAALSDRLKEILLTGTSSNVHVFLSDINVDLSEHINKEINNKRAKQKQAEMALAQNLIASGNIGTGSKEILDTGDYSPRSKDSLSNLKIDSVNRLVDSVSMTISGIKANLSKQGFDVTKMVQMQNYMNGVGINTLSEEQRELLIRKPTNALQSIFAKMQAFKVGSFSDQASGNTDNKDVFITGTTATFRSGGIPLTFGYGVMNDIGSSKDAGYLGSIYNTPKDITYIGTTFRSADGGKVKISVIGSVNRDLTTTRYTIPTTSANNIAFTVTKDVNIGKLGNLSFDASRSTTLFDSKYQPGSEAILNKQNGLNTNIGTDLMQALSLGVDHHLDLKALDASDNIYFNYSGMGYQNPGNNGFGGGKMKFGGNIKKTFYKNKLSVTLRTDLSNMPISYTSDDKWKSANIQLDSRYVFSRKFNVNFKYATISTDRKVNDVVTPVYSLKKLQIDGNTNYKLWKNYTVSHFSVGFQKYANGYVAQASGGLLMVNYIQSIILSSNSLTTTVFYNKELSPLHLIGNMLTSDVSYQYKLWNNINVSSGITYLSNTGIAKQAGIRQGIQLYANSHFDLDSYIDLRKNLITPLYPDLYSTCRGELSLKYHLKN